MAVTMIGPLELMLDHGHGDTTHCKRDEAQEGLCLCLGRLCTRQLPFLVWRLDDMPRNVSGLTWK